VSFLGTLQKGYDWTDFWCHRSLMVLRFWIERTKFFWHFQGKVRRILIVRIASIGDVVRATAVVRRLAERYPGATLDVLTSDVALPIIAEQPLVSRVFTLGELSELASYDWIVNLQNIPPPSSFLSGAGVSFRQLLEHLSNRVPHAFMTGRQLRRGREIPQTNPLYCVSEMEEIFRNALLPYDPHDYPETDIALDDAARTVARSRFPIPDSGKPVLGLFLGANSVGCGADEGFRTYSMEYLERLIQRFIADWTIVVIGQSQMRNSRELEHYREILRAQPAVVDWVDRTSLAELLHVIDQFDVFVTCDSGPLHIAMGRRVPVVALYTNFATFGMAPALRGKRYVALNSEPPCFLRSWRWKFFCPTCRDPKTRAWYCRPTQFVFGVDRVPLSDVERSIHELVGKRPTRRA
jgi:ADP-heptose:LPS heptosyltransferase